MFINFVVLNTAAEIGSSVGMLILTTGALIYTLRSKSRVQSCTTVMIFVTLILAFIFQSALSILDLMNTDNSYDEEEKYLGNLLYGLQFIFQWLSLLIFTLEYLSTEQEVRKVLDMPSTKNKFEWYFGVSVSLLIVAVVMTFFVCKWTGASYYDSWASSLGECIVSGSILSL